MDLITTTRDANGNEAMTDRTWLDWWRITLWCLAICGQAP